MFISTAVLVFQLESLQMFLVYVILKHAHYLCMSVLVPPMITSPVNGTVFHVKKGSSLTLTCTGSGIPVPNMKWMRARMTLVGPNAGDMTIGKSIGSQSLNYTIISASVDDNGWHTCIGDSALIGVSHTAESNIYVHVQGEIGLRCLYIFSLNSKRKFSSSLCNNNPGHGVFRD